LHLNASKGLGDAIYLRAVVVHLMKSEPITVYTRWPEVFFDLPVKVRGIESIGEADDLRSVAYTMRAPMTECMFDARCRVAGLEPPIDMRLDWPIRNTSLVSSVREQAAGRTVIVYQPQKMDLLSPDERSFKYALTGFDGFRVKVGRSPYVTDADLPCELDLLDKTSVLDAIDLCASADRVFGELCWLMPAAECLGKPFVCMFSHRAMASDEWVKNIDPRIIFRGSSQSEILFDY